jgi:hypothetical protein
MVDAGRKLHSPVESMKRIGNFALLKSFGRRARQSGKGVVLPFRQKSYPEYYHFTLVKRSLFIVSTVIYFIRG